VFADENASDGQCSEPRSCILSTAGVFAAEYATVDAQDSCIEFISLGGGLRLEDKVRVLGF